MDIVYAWHPQSGFCSDDKNQVRPDKSGFTSAHPKQFLFLDAARYHTHVERYVVCFDEIQKD